MHFEPIQLSLKLPIGKEWEMPMKLAFLPFIIALSTAFGCGSTTSTTPDVTVEMVGVFDPPEGATGSVTPLSQEYKLEAVNLVDADGGVVNLVTEAKSYKIVNRSQIIFYASLSDYKDKAYTKIAVQFNAALKTSTRTSSDIASTLTTTAPELAEAIKVETTSAVHLVIKAKWGNIVTKNEDTDEETVGQPTFTLKLE